MADPKRLKLTFMTATQRPIIPGYEKFWEEHFREAAESHWSWQMSALELRNALDILYKKIKENIRQFANGKPPAPFLPYSVCMMIAGQMLEALFKAVLISRVGALNSKGMFTHKTHNLIELANRVHLAVSDHEAWLLERLTHYVEWAGKYPIPLTSNNLLPRRRPGGGFGGPTHSKIIGKYADIEVAKQLAERIQRMLPASINVQKQGTQLHVKKQPWAQFGARLTQKKKQGM